ncbi:MAG: phosphopyruvate hydratase [Candidatus Diapherotrites archaeon]|nr:phosphopyruvate hydratase [Candidatus Diapherotrites archaeon]
MYEIKAVGARQIFDSRGNPTVECVIKTGFGRFKASVPSGASTGTREAVELRDGGKEFNGLGVSRAVQNVNEILSVVVKGRDCRRQKEIDSLLVKEDGTPNKSKLGANALLSVSLAAAKAGAAAENMELYDYISELSSRNPLMPVPALNIINGGKHAGNSLDFQEYQVLPVGFKSFKEAFSAGVEVFHQLKKNLEKNYGRSAINVGDEGGFAPQLRKVEEPIDEILKAVESVGYAKEMVIGLDVAASSFFMGGKYLIEKKSLGIVSMLEEYETLLKYYPIASIEDPFAESDYHAWEEIVKKLGKRVQILADDLTVSQEALVAEAIRRNRANALLLKVNQVGTLTEALESAALAHNSNWNVQVSHRSGETNGTFIADLAVGIGCGQIKSGAPCRGERLAKYNRLLEIEESSGALFAGRKAFKPK